MIFKAQEEEFKACVWVGKNNVSSMISKEEKKSFKFLIGS